MIGYNLPEFTEDSETKRPAYQLVLSMEVIAGIYNGTFTYWNDPVFTQLNPNITFPDKRHVLTTFTLHY